MEECCGEKRARAQRGKKNIGIPIDHEEKLIFINNLKVRGSFIIVIIFYLSFRWWYIALGFGI